MNFPKTPAFDLTNKKALVVGASSGIGLGCAVALAEYGAEVTLAARRSDKLLKLKSSFVRKGWKAKTMTLNVCDVERATNLITVEGPYDILINSAGTARHSKAEDTTIDDFQRVIDVNLKAAYFLTQTVAKGLMSANKSGSLINISSQMAHVGGQERAVYCASKHAVEGFTKAMAIEFGSSNIRVNTICPTFIITEMTIPTFNDPEKRQWVESKIKLGRVGKVEDIMGAAVYLASDASAMVTGSALMIDGGWTSD
ncbi:MAG: SDR family oxidoreductase [Pseudomonadota bacterium]|nr:SDR family oxidoreductase [Pseudomonadota bacterium]